MWKFVWIKINKLQSPTGGCLNFYQTRTVFLDWRLAVRGFASGATGRGGEKISSAMGLRARQSAAGVTGRGRRRRGCDRQCIVAGNQHKPYGRVCTIITGWVTTDIVFVCHIFTVRLTRFSVWIGEMRHKLANVSIVRCTFFFLCCGNDGHCLPYH